MTKVVVSKLKSKPASSSRDKTSVTEKRVRDAEGQKKTLLTLDSSSATFGHDLQYAFGKNVAKARRDNKRITGAADGVVAKR